MGEKGLDVYDNFMREIAIYGAGGFGREVACLIRMINESNLKPEWNLIGFFDDNPALKGQPISHYGICLGGVDELNRWERPLAVVIAIGNPQSLRKTAENINNPNVTFPNLIAPDTIFLDKEHLIMGRGNIICPRCTLSCDVVMADFNILVGNNPIGHDVKIGSYNVVMPSVNICGGVQMGDCNMLGVQSVVLQYMKIGDNVQLGANSVLMRNAKNDGSYFGNPARQTSST